MVYIFDRETTVEGGFRLPYSTQLHEDIERLVTAGWLARASDDPDVLMYIGIETIADVLETGNMARAYEKQ